MQDNNTSVNDPPAAKTVIFYYTGTGNSLWIARTLAQEFGNTELISMTDSDINPDEIDAQVIGLVFPVHIWGVPGRVLGYLDQLREMSPQYIFAVANNAGQVANTLVQLRKVMESKGMKLSSGWSVVLPSITFPGEDPVL